MKNPARNRIGVCLASGRSFTLIELLLVVIIIGIFAGLAVPNFAGVYAQFQLRETAGNIAYLMRYAQSRAIIKDKDHRLAVNAENYYLEQLFDSGEQGDTFQPIAGRMGRVFSIPAEITVECEKPLIRFYSDGNIDKARIYLHDKRGDDFTVSTQEQTGYVQIFDFKVK